MKYRSRSEIVRSILRAGNASEGTSRTKVLYKSYLSTDQLKEYLRILQENGLIAYELRTAMLQNNTERHTIIAATQ
jgi:predicted transcriptional regulator